MKKKSNKRQVKNRTFQAKRGHVYQAQDQGAKAIFGNPELMAQLLRDFVPIPELKDVTSEDIEDISERFLPLNQEERDADSIKRVRLKYLPCYIISLVEHKAQVDFRAPFKLLQYITLVWDDYEKEVNRENPGASRRKDFRYPPVIPIIYYEGPGSWTAAMNMRDRVFMPEIFGKYIPNFEYELIRVHDYSTKELVEKGNELSLIMLINQMRSSEDFARLKEIPGEYFQNIEKKSSREILQILSRVIMLLLRRLNVPMEEIQTVTDRIWKGETEMLFDSFVGYDIQEVRKTSKAEGRKEGRIETEIQMIRKMLGKGYTAEQIADLLEREKTYVNRISRLHSQYPNDDNTQFMEKYYSKE